MARPRVKICGLTRWEDADLAVRLGADALGFILWKGSPRHLPTAEVADITRRVPPLVTRVGVVVNALAAQVDALAAAGGLDVIQLHGDEPIAEYAQGIQTRLIRAVSLEKEDDVAVAVALPPHVTVLVDAADRARRGGTGQRANWTYAAQVAQRRPVILAGGLTAETIVEAVERVGPWAVDVASGVEDAPGIKNAKRMENFFRALEQVS
jgi:phosphoribosylanthranilate isomerase